MTNYIQLFAEFFPLITKDTFLFKWKDRITLWFLARLCHLFSSLFSWVSSQPMHTFILFLSIGPRVRTKREWLCLVKTRSWVGKNIDNFPHEIPSFSPSLPILVPLLLCLASLTSLGYTGERTKTKFICIKRHFVSIDDC